MMKKKECYIKWYTDAEYYKATMEIGGTKIQDAIYWGIFEQMPEWHKANEYELPDKPQKKYCIIW